MAPSQIFWIWLLVAGTQGVKDGDMRLVDGKGANEGRVEIFYSGQWGTVCDDQWDLLDANVVCHALGFENATQALGRAAFGPGSGPILLDEMECMGTEPSLANCKSLGWLLSNCRHEEDAGVICGHKTRAIHILDLSSELPKDLRQIFDSQSDCDLSIWVKVKKEETEEEEVKKDLSICAHKLILSANPEAQALLRGPGNVITLQVDSECMPFITDFIRYFYSRRIDVSLSSVKCFHKLASANGAEQLQVYCDHRFATLLLQDPSFQLPLDLYTYALAMQNSKLEGVCVQFLAWNFEALMQAKVWPYVPVSLLQDLLSRSELAVPSEYALLQALDIWSRENHTSPEEIVSLLEKVRFPMLLPEDLFKLQFNLSLYWNHEALFQKKIMQALEFHTVPFLLLTQYRGLKLSMDTYKPRLYTSATWSTSIMDIFSKAQGSSFIEKDHYYRPYTSSWYPQYKFPQVTSSHSQFFQTPQHTSFLFQNKHISWSFRYLATPQNCWDYGGFSCSSTELPLLGLSKSGYSDPAIGYENKALMICRGNFVAAVSDFKEQKAMIPEPLSTSESRNASFFPCPAGFFSSFRMVIRPFYLTNSMNLS
ncbi:galectin-3-binding protein isoform X2 [Erinaceus europaeus]|nr:galectin-3-binding protein isoform X2 [Erinaceus europaeus]